MGKWLLLWLLTAGVWAQPAWKAFRSPGSGFSGVFPFAPKASQRQTETPLGAVTTRIYSSSAGAASYAVAVTDLPGAAVKFASDRVIADAKEGVLKDAQARQIGWTEIAQGHELTYRSAQNQGWCRILLIDQRLYVVDARVSKGAAKKQWVDPFLSRFVPRK